MTRLIRLGALAAIIGGGLRIVSTFIPYVARSAGLEALYAVIDLGMLFGLMAAYLAHAERVGRSGFIACAIALAALASIVGPDAAMFGIDFYLLGSFIYTLALAVFSLSLLHTAQLMLPALCWIFSAVCGIAFALSASPAAFALAGLVLGLGFVIAGVQLQRQTR